MSNWLCQIMGDLNLKWLVRTSWLTPSIISQYTLLVPVTMLQALLGTQSSSMFTLTHTGLQCCFNCQEKGEWSCLRCSEVFPSLPFCPQGPPGFPGPQGPPGTPVRFFFQMPFLLSFLDLWSYFKWGNSFVVFLFCCSIIPVSLSDREGPLCWHTCPPLAAWIYCFRRIEMLNGWTLRRIHLWRGSALWQVSELLLGDAPVFSFEPAVRDKLVLLNN